LFPVTFQLTFLISSIELNELVSLLFIEVLQASPQAFVVEILFPLRQAERVVERIKGGLMSCGHFFERQMLFPSALVILQGDIFCNSEEKGFKLGCKLQAAINSSAGAKNGFTSQIFWIPAEVSREESDEFLKS